MPLLLISSGANNWLSGVLRLNTDNRWQNNSFPESSFLHILGWRKQDREALGAAFWFYQPDTEVVFYGSSSTVLPAGHGGDVDATSVDDDSSSKEVASTSKESEEAVARLRSLGTIYDNITNFFPPRSAADLLGLERRYDFDLGLDRTWQATDDDTGKITSKDVQFMLDWFEKGGAQTSDEDEDKKERAQAILRALYLLSEEEVKKIAGAPDIAWNGSPANEALAKQSENIAPSDPWRRLQFVEQIVAGERPWASGPSASGTPEGVLEEVMRFLDVHIRIFVPSSTLSFPVCSHLWRIFGVSLAYLRVYLVYHKVLCKLV